MKTKVKIKNHVCYYCGTKNLHFEKPDDKPLLFGKDELLHVCRNKQLQPKSIRREATDELYSKLASNPVVPMPNVELALGRPFTDYPEGTIMIMGQEDESVVVVLKDDIRGLIKILVDHI